MNKKILINNNEFFIDIKNIKSIIPTKKNNEIYSAITFKNGNRIIIPMPPMTFYKKIR